jgi:hypothetical protein
MKSQAKEGSKGGRAGQANEGPKAGRMVAKEGSRGGKNHERDIKLAEGLEHGSAYPAHKKGLVSGLGGKQAGSPANSGESNHESLRTGSKPSPEKVMGAPMNASARKKAHGFNERSIAGNAEKEGGW